MIPTKLYIYGALGLIASAGLFLAYTTVRHWHTQSEAYKALEVEFTQYRSSVQAQLELRSKQEKINDDVRANLAAALRETDTALRSASDRLSAVRLCKPTRSVSASPAPSSAPTRVDDTTSAGELPATTGADLGDLANSADHCRAQLSGLQNWLRLQRGDLAHVE